MKTHTLLFLAIVFLLSNNLIGQNSGFHPRLDRENDPPSDCGNKIVRYDRNLASITDTVKCYYWYDSEEWLLNLLYINTYDETGRLLQTVIRFLDLQTQEFTNSQRSDYTYYPNDSLQSELHFLWNPELEGENWDETSLKEYEYNDQDFVSFVMIYFSPYGEHELNLGRREFYAYNTENLPDTVHTQYWNTNESAWFYSYRYRYYYDEQMRLAEEYTDWANSFDEIFSSFQRIIHTPNEDDNSLIKITQYSDTGLWVNSWRDYHSLNEQNLSDSILFQQWNTMEMMWDTTVMELWLFDYNAMGQMTEFITQSIYIFPVNVRRQAYTFNDNGVLSESLVQDWSHADSSWWNKNKCLYPPSPVVTAVFDNLKTNAEQLLVYPNPATDFIEIQSEIPAEFSGTVSIYNTNGQLVKESVFHKGNKISVAGIPPGLYLIWFSGDGFTQTTKLLIK